jgi:isopentenyl-diphosphate delta-isomerase
MSKVSTIKTIKKRKESHIDIALGHVVVNQRKTTGFEDVKLIYCALPELDYDKIDMSVHFFKKKIAAPFMIDAITGGFEKATKINKGLAAAAEKEGIPFALGSQRAMIEDPALTKTYYVRDVAPTIPIVGNIGAVNIKEKKLREGIEGALKAIDADALQIHLNPLQEIIQPEGDRNFEGCLAAIAETCDIVDVPVIVKEVGSGISGDVAVQLEKAGVSAINVAGAGGTSWSRLEVYRRSKRLERFADSGLPTVLSLVDTLRHTKKPVIVSGGVRTGVDVAKGISLGASWAAAALPFLQAWAKGQLDETLSRWKEELKVTMFVVGAGNIEQLKLKKPFIIGKTADFLHAWEESRKQ